MRIRSQILFFTLIILLLLSACLESDERTRRYLTEVTSIEPDSTAQPGELEDIDKLFVNFLMTRNQDVNCTAFRCTLAEPSFYERFKTIIINIWRRFITKQDLARLPEYSLYKGSCSFETAPMKETAKNYDKWFEEMAKITEQAIRGDVKPLSTQIPRDAFFYFSMGAGTNGKEFEYANQYCGNGMQIVPYWSRGIPYKYPPTGPAKCYLMANTIPLYAFYSGVPSQELTASNWSLIIERTVNISKKLDALDSPVLITTEVNVSSKSNNGLPVSRYLADQAAAVLKNCDKCIVVITPAFNDMNVILGPQGVLTLLEKIYPSEWNDYKKRIIIGQPLIINDLPLSDEVGASVIANITHIDSLPRQVMVHYNIPTLYIYVGGYPQIKEVVSKIDPNFLERIGRPSSTNSYSKPIVKVDQRAIASTVYKMYFTIPDLMRAGIIGFVYPNFINNTRNEFCEDCIPIMSSTKGIETDIGMAFMKQCYNYSMTSVSPVIFAERGGKFDMSCVFTRTMPEANVMREYSGFTREDADLLAYVRSVTPFYGCDNCLGYPPEFFTLGLESTLYASYSNMPKACSKFRDEIIKWASYWPEGTTYFTDFIQSLDPLLVVSVIYQESNFRENAKSSSPTCRALGLMQICPNYHPPSQAPAECKALNAYKNYLEEMQRIASHYGSTRDSDREREEREALERLYFNPEFNICYGTNILAEYIWEANDKLQDQSSIEYKTLLGRDDPITSLWMAHYIGLSYYNGGIRGTQNAILNWTRARETGSISYCPRNTSVTSEELKNMEFPEYMYRCYNNKELGEYALKILARYAALVDNDDCIEMCGAFHESSKGFSNVGFSDGTFSHYPINPALNGVCITSWPGESRDHGRRRHTGIDIAAPIGTPVYAVADGKVKSINLNPNTLAGYSITLDHGNGFTSFYAHLNGTFLVSLNEFVKAGTVIAYSGNSGTSTTGPHLHFSFRINDEPLDLATAKEFVNTFRYRMCKLPP